MHLFSSFPSIEQTFPTSFQKTSQEKEQEKEDDTSTDPSNNSQKKIDQLTKLVLKNQNDIKNLKRQHEELKVSIEGINSQLINLNSIFSSIALHSTSHGIEQDDFLKKMREDVESTRQIIVDLSEKTTVLFKLAIQSSTKESS